MKKILYIIPGYMNDPFNPIGIELARHALKNAIVPVLITIDWKKKKNRKVSFKEHLDDFERQVKIGKYDKTYVFGFSFGAMIAFLTAAKIKPNALILGSLSPWFKEDVINLKKSDLKWWKETYLDNPPLFNALAQKIKARAYILVGSKESPELIDRAKDAHRLIKKSTLKIIPGVGHDISKRKYMEAIRSVIERL